uniref:Uncharacterized protein n=1 Tax=Setaria viridis TaxID=4556 RepID=A0A4U6V089_SETVI|nr:LOW QUALITY PROTEIN: hypothetical protein SEVIR_4G137000v2 [Setaria viridis]
MVSQAPMAVALCKKINCVARVLAYALLEWILIALLLTNSVFSYLISRFAAFFGLAPPCALAPASALFERHAHRGVGGTEPLRRVLCDAHAAELSCLGYCSEHRRLADAGDMCEDCAAAPGKALLSWMGRSELGERELACACCGVVLRLLLAALLAPHAGAAWHRLRQQGRGRDGVGVAAGEGLSNGDEWRTRPQEGEGEVEERTGVGAGVEVASGGDLSGGDGGIWWVVLVAKESH